MLILNPLVDIDNPLHNISGIRTTALGHVFCYVASSPDPTCTVRFNISVIIAPLRHSTNV